MPTRGVYFEVGDIWSYRKLRESISTALKNTTNDYKFGENTFLYLRYQGVAENPLLSHRIRSNFYFNLELIYDYFLRGETEYLQIFVRYLKSTS